MALRGNAEAKAKDIDLQRVRNDAEDDGGIDFGRELSGFVDAFMSRNDDQLAAARDTLAANMGAEGMVEAAAVAGNFQRMVRIADCIGIPIDAPRLEMTAEVREQLGINDFHSAQNTFRD